MRLFLTVATVVFLYLVDAEGAGITHVCGCVLRASRAELFDCLAQSVSPEDAPQPGRLACPASFQSRFQVRDIYFDLPGLLTLFLCTGCTSILPCMPLQECRAGGREPRILGDATEKL